MTDQSKERAMQLITFRIAGQELGIDIMTVREIRTWTQPMPMPHSVDHVLGVIDLRGNVLPVVDLSSQLGWGRVEATPNHIIIVLCIADKLQGIVVDAVCDIVDVPSGELRPAPADSWNSEAGSVLGLMSRGDRMITVISLGEVKTGDEMSAAA